MLQRPLIAPTANPLLEKALAEKLQRRRESGGSLGGLEPLAVRLGLLQNSLRPRFRDPQLVVFAADHGLAVEGLGIPQARSTAELVRRLLMRRLPVAAFARSQHVELSVVDCGLADNLPAHEHMLVRKIAYGTRNPRVAQAMSMEQAQAGLRVGTEIGEQLRGNLLMCAAVGVGSQEAAALLLARLGRLSLRSLLAPAGAPVDDESPPRLVLLERVMARHREAREPMEALAAFGGFEIAVMVGAMLSAASRRHLIMVDGLPACAALLLASRLAPAVTDYCVFCRSHSQRGLTQALGLFGASALLEMGLEALDGTGAVLAWPMVASASALLSEVPEGEDAGESRPAVLGPAETQEA